MGLNTGDNKRLSSVELFQIREKLLKEKGLWIYAVKCESEEDEVWHVRVITRLYSTPAKEMWLEAWTAGNFSSALLALEFGIITETNKP